MWPPQAGLLATMQPSLSLLNWDRTSDLPAFYTSLYVLALSRLKKTLDCKLDGCTCSVVVPDLCDRANALGKWGKRVMEYFAVNSLAGEEKPETGKQKRGTSRDTFPADQSDCCLRERVKKYYNKRSVALVSRISLFRHFKFMSFSRCA